MELIVFIVFQLLMEIQSYKFPNVRVSPAVINESSSVKISCETQPGIAVNECYFYLNRKNKQTKVRSSCELDLTGAEVLIWTGGKSPGIISIYCYYTMPFQNFPVSSAESDPAIVRYMESTTTAHTSTLIKISTSGVHPSPVHPKHHSPYKDIWLIMLVSTGMGVILSGLMCVCLLTSKGRRKRQKMRSKKAEVLSQGIGVVCSGPAEKTDTSRLMSEGLESHDQNTPNATETSISTVNSIYQPSDVLANQQQKEGNVKENENVYHLYCTIIDKPVQEIQSNTEV